MSSDALRDVRLAQPLSEPERLQLVLWRPGRPGPYGTILRDGVRPPFSVKLYVPWLDNPFGILFIATSEQGLELGRRRFHYVCIDAPDRELTNLLDLISFDDVMRETNRVEELATLKLVPDDEL